MTMLFGFLLVFNLIGAGLNLALKNWSIAAVCIAAALGLYGALFPT